MVIAGLVVAAFMLFLCVHPFVTYPLSLLLFAPRRAPTVAPREDAATPSMAICMSAFNEAAVIEAKMESLLAMAARYPGDVTIHVYADGGQDGTAEILARYRDRADIVLSDERRGKTYGLNLLVNRSSSDLLLFTDANVVSDDTALAELGRPFADPAIGLACARLTYVNAPESATTETGAMYWEIEERIKRIESDTVGLVGVDGAMFAVRRSMYRQAPPHLIDDLFVSLGVLIRNGRIITVDGVVVHERGAVRAEEEFRRKKRIACQAWNVHRELWPELRRMPALRLYGYASHRLVKWLTPFFALGAALGLLVAAAGLIGFLPTLLLAAGGGALLLLGDRLAVRPASLIATAIYSLAGVGVGICQSVLLGRTYTVWTPAGSVREASQTSTRTGS